MSLTRWLVCQIKNTDYGRFQANQPGNDVLLAWLEESFRRKPSPEIRYSDFRMDFLGLVRHLREFSHLKAMEVIAVLNSSQRRFRGQQRGLGHKRFVVDTTQNRGRLFDAIHMALELFNNRVGHRCPALRFTLQWKLGVASGTEFWMNAMGAFLVFELD